VCVIAEYERRVVGAEIYRPYSIAIAFPRERARGARRQRALAQLIHIERKGRLDSAFPYTAVSPGTTTAHFTSPIFEIPYGNIGIHFAAHVLR
jgi:hypothetical protein